MIFVLIRIFPVLISLLHFVLFRTIFYVNDFWYWPVILLLILDILYFLFIFYKKRDGIIFIFLFHSLVFLLAGLVYILILGSDIVINSFLIIWSLIYFIYLESVFHHLYQTKRVLLFNLRNVVSYINLIAIFLLVSALINFYIFINFSWGAVFLIFLTCLIILILTQFKLNKIEYKKIILYTIILFLIFAEFIIVVMFLPVSFYVSAVIISLLYYLLISLSLLNIKGGLTTSVLMQYIVFTVVSLILVSITSQWL